MGRGDADTRFPQIIINDHAESRRGIRHVYERLSLDVAWAYRFQHGETMVAGQNDKERFARQTFEHQVGHLRLRSKEGDVDLTSEESTRKFGRCLTDEDHLDARQLVVKQPHGFREPVHLGSRQKSHDERRLGRVRGPPRRVPGCLDLSQCQPGMIEKCTTSRRQLDPVNAPIEKLSAYLSFQIAQLPTEGRLRGVQPALGRERDAALLGDRYEIAQVP